MGIVETRFKNETTRLKGKKLRKLRHDVYARAGGCCEECGAPAPENGSIFYRGHLSHIKSRGAGGEDSTNNTRWLCPRCHIYDGGEHGLRWSSLKKRRA